MNKVILMGRITRDPEVRYAQGAQAKAVANYTIAVNRSYKRDGEPDADFINCVAFGARGEFAGKYFKKGMMVAVVGELRIDTYTDKEGTKHWTTKVAITEQHFAEGRRNSDNNGQNNPPAAPGNNNASYSQYPNAQGAQYAPANANGLPPAPVPQAPQAPQQYYGAPQYGTQQAMNQYPDLPDGYTMPDGFTAADVEDDLPF